jgi:GDP-D-mannose 3', 5'-epimerase
MYPGRKELGGRNSDNTLLRQVLCWEPEISLEVGLRRNYKWIEGMLTKEEGLLKAANQEAVRSVQL